MVDLQQWMINLMAPDIGRLVVGILVFFSVIEAIARLKEWTK
jgi:hypothetical protein